MAINLDSIAGFVLNLVLIILSIVVTLATAVGVFFWAKWQKRYNQFKCIIWEEDSFGNPQETYDRAGIFVDAKTKNKRLFLKKNKVGLNPDKIPYIKGDKKVKKIYLRKTGLKNFHFVKVTIPDLTPAVTLTVGEEDVNWAINSYDRQKKLFSSSMLLQLMPFITIAFVTIIILILFIYFFKNFTVLKDMAIAMQEAAQTIASAKTGTVVIG